jgi:hypothetical protein
MRKRPTARPRERLLQPQASAVIIAYEGKETEPLYFQALVRELGLTSISILKHMATDPRSIVTQARDERDLLRAAKAWKPGDFAWAVFDGDEHIAVNRSNWHEAINMAQANNIGLAISNPSFELWYLLHYREHYTNITRQQAISALKENAAGYKKNVVLFPKPLGKPETFLAIERARDLAQRAAANNCGKYDNPCTHVSELVALLFEIHEQMNPG